MKVKYFKNIIRIELFNRLFLFHIHYKVGFCLRIGKGSEVGGIKKLDFEGFESLEKCHTWIGKKEIEETKAFKIADLVNLDQKTNRIK